jgi:hypothetical protein
LDAVKERREKSLDDEVSDQHRVLKDPKLTLQFLMNCNNLGAVTGVNFLAVVAGIFQ